MVEKPSRRDQILNAAAELFARHGFHGVGIDDIGAAVGISGPALYRHFRSKDAMLGEMLTSISERLLDGGQARVDAASNADEALRDLIGWHVDFALDDPALITVQMRNLANLTDPDRRPRACLTTPLRRGVGGDDPAHSSRFRRTDRPCRRARRVRSHQLDAAQCSPGP